MKVDQREYFRMALSSATLDLSIFKKVHSSV